LTAYSRRRIVECMVSTEQTFTAVWVAIDPLGDRVTFEVGLDPKKRGKWLLWRQNIYGGAFESRRFDTAEATKAFGDSLTTRRPVSWQLVKGSK